MEQDTSPYHDQPTEAEFNPTQDAPVRVLSLRKNFLSLIIISAVIIFGVAGYMWVIYESGEHLICSNIDQQAICESTGGEFNSCCCPVGALCGPCPPACDCPSDSVWNNKSGCLLKNSMEGFSQLCESTDGIVYKDCANRMAEFCGTDIWLDGVHVGCDCPDGETWDFDKGCDSRYPLSDKVLCQGTGGVYAPCNCPEGAYCKCAPPCRCPDGESFGSQGCQDKNIIQLDISYRVCSRDDECIASCFYVFRGEN